MPRTVAASLFAAVILLASGPGAAGEIVVPAGPNSWLFDAAGTSVPAAEVTTDGGIRNWKDAARRIRIYVWLGSPGDLDVSLVASVAGGASTIQCAMDGQVRALAITSAVPAPVTVGSFTIGRAGYQCLELTGVSRTSTTFGDIDQVKLSGAAAQGEVHFLKDDLHFGRRGPSVHLSYRLPTEAQDICYVYNEVTVPVGQDAVGTYAMANGFGEGYCGMQVNSRSERRVLFSVWSPFTTDDPKQIPPGDRIIVLAKGKGVQTNDFGNEGSGGQSYLVYPWKAGTTYRFLLRGEPAADGSTVYTAYVAPAGTEPWLLIASFRRPRTSTYLKRWHSFLENFIPAAGAITREARFTNQWARDRTGRWFAVTEAGFTTDATGRKQARLDHTGGVAGDGQFFLRNGGFFSDGIPSGATFTRVPSAQPPVIDLALLPTE